MLGSKCDCEEEEEGEEGDDPAQGFGNGAEGLGLAGGEVPSAKSAAPDETIVRPVNGVAAELWFAHVSNLQGGKGVRSEPG